MTPTRELALQVSSHLNACLTHADVEVEDAGPAEGASVESPNSKPKSKGKGKGKAKAKPAEVQGDKPKHPPLVCVAAIVGGMSAQKQRRVLSRGVDVLVATPGRLWDIIQEVTYSGIPFAHPYLNPVSVGRRAGLTNRKSAVPRA